jgi:hypothetical protein
MHSLQVTLALGALLSVVSAGSIGHSHRHSERHQHLHPQSRSTPISNTTTSFHFLAAATSSYRLVDTYDHNNFFNSFSFFTAPDPTHGYVSYQSRASADARGLVSTPNNQVRFGVDSTTYNPAGGRASVRLTSNKAYTHGLFIADIAHMPSATCGVWPAFWTFGPGWPNSGEIDIIEGVNTQTSNTVTLHTSAGCQVNNFGSLGGTYTTSANCNAGNGNQGCGANTGNGASYGNGFNANGGGVYAMQWESSGIYVWFFPRNAIPGDISAGQPNTRNWGLPLVAFNNAGCNFDAHFANHNIVFDTTFCGDWAGAVWGQTCGAQASTCQAYVAGNPGAFSNAYWLINSVKVYHL